MKVRCIQRVIASGRKAKRGHVEGRHDDVERRNGDVVGRNGDVEGSRVQENKEGTVAGVGASTRRGKERWWQVCWVEGGRSDGCG